MRCSLLFQSVRCIVLKKVEFENDQSLDPKGVKNTMDDLMKESMKEEMFRGKWNPQEIKCKKKNYLFGRSLCQR